MLGDFNGQENREQTEHCIFGDSFLGFGDGLDVGIRNRVVTLTLGGLPQHASATLTFDLLTIDSWDGNGQPDIFGVTVNQGPNLLFSSFDPDLSDSGKREEFRGKVKKALGR